MKYAVITLALLLTVSLCINLFFQMRPPQVAPKDSSAPSGGIRVSDATMMPDELLGEWIPEHKSSGDHFADSEIIRRSTKICEHKAFIINFASSEGKTTRKNHGKLLQ